MLNAYTISESSFRIPGQGSGFNLCMGSNQDSFEFGTHKNHMESLDHFNDEPSPDLKGQGRTGQQKEMHKNYQMKLKTEMCKLYELGFVCPYGDKCSFAHGASELKQRNHMASKYKTVRCTKFHKKSYCQYGSRCQFVHKKMKKGGFKGLKPRYQQVLECFESLPEYEKCKQGKDLLDLMHESSLEVFKLPKLSVFELIRSS